jgi:N-acetylglutamate synthase
MARDLEELGRSADENLAGSWAALGRATGALGASDRCTFVATGIPAAFFNGAYAAGPVADPDHVVANAIEFMAERGVPWLLWVRTGVDEGLLAAGRRAGLTDAGGPPALALPVIPDIPPPPDGLELRLAHTPSDVDDFRDLTSRGFEMPTEIAATLIADSLLDDPAIAMVIGSVEGTPVSCALVSATGATAGIYNVATPPEHRRCGYGAAVTWAAIAEGAERGCDHSILQASEMGAPVYRAMGYVDIGNYVQLEGPPRIP